ncbi:MAG: sensor domain-containing diguanylate cyclase [Candidatus Omnitrophica bacterium]|nr:sensor domain-containing diguanylate cyclase [Candidatus Omnitrophota bacterium]
MTEKRKKQLFDSAFSLSLAIFLPLASAFFLAAFIYPALFHLISIGLGTVLAYLLVLNHRQNQEDSLLQLRLQSVDEQANLIEDEIIKQEAALDSLSEKIINFSELKGLTEHLSMCLTLEDTSRTLSEEVNKLFGDKDTTIILYLFHSKTGELGISSSQKGQMRVNLKTKKGDIFDQWIVKAMQPLLVEDTHRDYRFDFDKIKKDEPRPIRSVISVPLKAGHKALGILRIDSPREKRFVTEDLRFLTTIADLGALAIENAQLYERIEQLAIKDALTGLYLKRYLMERLQEEISRQGRRKTEMSFLMIDLDYFKQYNDKYGHVAGDIVLRAVGFILAENFREPGNVVCRYGGEEFAVLLPDCPREKALEMAEAARQRIGEQTVILRRMKTSITVSIGVAAYPKDADNKQEFIHKADQALYRAKQEGRNKVCAA